MIIDSHSHWLPAEIINNAHFFSKAWGDIDAQVAMMDARGIDKAVLSYPTTDAHLKLGSISEVTYAFNDNVAKVMKRFPGRFIGAAVLPIDNASDMLDEFKRATEELGFQALSLASSYNGRYLDDKLFIPVYAESQKKDIPIFVHPQIVNPIGYDRVQDALLTPVIEYVFDTTICIGKLLMADIFREYPGVKFVFAYFGGVICHLPSRFDSTYQMLRGIDLVKDLRANPSEYLKNIYVDTSGDTSAANFQAALSLVGAKRILWGSDWPAKKDPAVSLKAVGALPLTQKEKDGILGENIQGLF
ncbi:MAG: amidohydrolase family protein [Candidatus Omnitrophota bacterium]